MFYTLINVYRKARQTFEKLIRYKNKLFKILIIIIDALCFDNVYEEVKQNFSKLDIKINYLKTLPSSSKSLLMP